MSDSSGFERIRRSVVADDAIGLLKAMIVRGDLVAHQRLPPERDLAEMLGVSRPTLRESIRALSSLNILESRHGEGTFVTSLEPSLLSQPIGFVLELSPAKLQELTEFRSILEPAAAGLAAERMTDDALAQFEQVFQAFEQLDEDDMQGRGALDAQFHGLVSEASGNVIISTVNASIASLVRASRDRTLPMSQGRIAEARSELLAMLEAFRARDSAAARAAMADHIRHVAAYVDQTDETAPSAGPRESPEVRRTPNGPGIDSVNTVGTEVS